MRQLITEKSAAIPKDLFSVTIHEGMKKAGKAFEKLIGDVANVTLQQLFENIIREAGVLTALCKAMISIGNYRCLPVYLIL